MFLIKKIIFFSLCLFLFLPAIARAEVTCCACTLVSNPVTFANFACMQGDHTCAATCSNRDSSWTTYQPEGSEPIFAKGETVTCCQCSNVTYKMCVVLNQTCPTICGSHGFDEVGGTWLRGTTETPAGSGETQGLKTGETPQEETTTGIAPTEPQEPNINLPIPGFLGFSEVKVSDGGYLDIPWIAEYFTAVFNWLLAIVGAVATVMIMVGGFQYLIAGGDRGRIAKAKERITNALIGLFLALGSYLILYVINPDLTTFKNIRISVTQRLETEYSTDPPVSAEELQEYAANPGSPPPPAIAPTGGTASVGTGRVPYYQQYFTAGNSPWGNTCCGSGPPTQETCQGPIAERSVPNVPVNRHTIGESGCCITSQAMILQYFAPDQRITPYETSLHSPSNCTLSPPGNTVSGIRQTIYRISSASDENLNFIKNKLREGHPILFRCAPCVGLTASRTPSKAHGGHCMVLTGYDGTTFTVNDPGSNERTRTVYITNDMMNAMVNNERGICARFNCTCNPSSTTSARTVARCESACNARSNGMFWYYYR